jgi:GNAT superfamily N-acetyltransferase
MLYFIRARKDRSIRYHTVAYHYTWWRDDPLPALPPLPEFRVVATQDVALLAELHGLDGPRMAARIAEGSQPYVAWLGDSPAAYGWSAARTFGVEEAGVAWSLSPEERGLWDFETLPAWRGRGIYPRLLQSIVQAEVAEAGRFWIGHRADNPASMRGIRAAGFQLIGIVALTAADQWAEILRGNPERAYANPMAQGLEFVEAADEDLVLADFSSL